jgi:hypothetical protein
MMRHGYLAIFFLLVTLLLTSGFASSWQEPTTAVLEKDTMISVLLAHPLDAGKAKVGDKVEARLQEALTGRDNVLIAHASALVVGRVILVQSHTDQPGHSMIVLAFDSIQDDAREIPVRAVVTGITPAPRKVVEPARVRNHPTSGDDAMSRAAGPMVDDSGRYIVPSHPPASEGGLAGPAFVNSPDIGPIEVAANAAGQTRLTALDKKDLKIKTDVLLTLRLNNPKPKQ